MVLYVFAGPNGSGKSTVIKDYIPYYGLDGIEYICPDVYVSTLFSDIEDVYERYKKAIDFAEYKRYKLLREKRSMIIETILSRSDKLDFIKEAKASGYRIVSVFVSAVSSDINCDRVKKRVAEGGHNVPEDKIRARYQRSTENLPLLAELSDELYVYDNSGKRPILAISLIDEEMIAAAETPEWVKKYLK